MIFRIGTVYRDTQGVDGCPVYHEIIGITMDAIVISDFGIGIHVNEIEYSISEQALMSKIHSGLWIEQHSGDE